MSLSRTDRRTPEAAGEAASAEDHAKPDPHRKIMWATEAEPCLTRNWLTEELIHFSEKHWHCTREEAIGRLLAKH